MSQNIQHTETFSWPGQNSPVVNTLTGQDEQNLGFTIANGVSNSQFNFTLHNGKVQELIIYSDQNITVVTNSSGSPQDTFNMIGGTPLVWNVNMPTAFPCNGSVTTIYVSNASGLAANVQIRSLQLNP